MQSVLRMDFLFSKEEEFANNKIFKLNPSTNKHLLYVFGPYKIRVNISVVPIRLQPK